MNMFKRLILLAAGFMAAAIFAASPAWAAPCFSGKTSTAIASPTSVIADGITTSTITVTVKKTNGSSAGSGITVTLTAGSGSSIISPLSATTPANGIVTFTVKDAVVEAVTYTAVASKAGCGSVTLTKKPVVSFVRAAPTVAKSFSPATIAANGTSTLTVTLTNPNTSSITGATFTDAYPANLLNAGAPALSNTCGGIATAAAGGTSLTLSGGTIPASGSCTVTVTVTSAIAGSYVNSTGAVTSTNALAGTAASATLTVTAISASLSTVTASPTTVLANGVATSTITVTLRDGAGLVVSGKTVTLTKSGGSSTISAASGPSDVNGVVTFTVKDTVAETTTYTAKDTTDNITVTQTAAVTFVKVPIFKSFATSPIAINGTSTLTVTLTNATGAIVSGAGFTDTYPAGLVNASNPSASGCGAGVLSGTNGGNTLGMTGATIAANSACVVSVSVTAATAGTYTNTATNTALATSTASLIVTAISPTLSTVSASPASVAANGTSTSTITVTLKDGAGNPVPGKTVSLGAASGSSVITAVSNAAGVAIFTVTDTVAEGPITYTATDTTDSITVTQTASVTFTLITAPTVTKSFNPATIADNGTSTLTITLTNPNAAAINGVAFTDSYPVDLVNTSTLVLSNTCGGANPGTVVNGMTLTLSGGTIPASGSCAVSVQVTAATLSPSLTNATGAVTSSNATSGTSASATLTVVDVSATNSTVVASPITVPADNSTTSTITVTLLDGGGNPVAAKDVSLAATGSSTCTPICAPLSVVTTDVNGQAIFTVKDGTVESVAYTATDNTDSITITQQAIVTFGNAVGSFNAFDTGTAAGTTTGGYIQTKISGAAFALDVVALTTGSAVFTGFTGTVKVELVDGSSGACATYASIQMLANQTFSVGDSGRHRIASITEANAWKNVRVRISYPVVTPTSISCSNDAFAIRPNSLSASVTDANWQTAGTARTLNNSGATGGNVHKAGQPFTIQATAYNAAGTPAITSNYNGSPAVQNNACTLPTPSCTNGALTPGAWTAAGGTVTSTTATYSDAGSFNLTLQDTSFASVDNGDGTAADCTGYYICSSAISVGRFVPDHFAVTTNNGPQFKTFNNTACATRSFTYIGQQFGYVTTPQILVTAQNASNVTTANYTSNLWKLATAAGAQDCTTIPDICTLTSGSVTQTYTYTTTPAATPNWDNTQVSLGTPTIAAGTIALGTSGTGTVTGNAADLLAFKRSITTPQALFTASITLTDSVKDTSEAGNCGVANCDIATLTSAAFNPIAFDSGNEFRYGRLKLSNANGSELLNLPIPLQAQYWNGTAFVTNSADNCTTLAPNNIKLTAPPAGVSATVGGAFLSGVGSLTLSKPATPAKVAVDLCVDLGADPGGGTVCSATSAALSFLQGLWAPGSSYNNDPTARATFGVYKGAKEFIYLRENY